MGSVETTPQGGLRIPSTPTRVGVFPYRLPDGSTRREYRPPDEVFRADSLASLRSAPVTDLHPEVDGVRVPVTIENWRSFAVGHVAEDVRQNGDHVAAPLVILDQPMIDKIQGGKRRELSCGYSCDLDPTPGTTPDGLVYDAIQRNILYNHVAIGPDGWGRAGPTAALRLDSTDGTQVGEAETMKIKLSDGREVEAGSPEHIKDLESQRDKANGRADAAEAQAAKASTTIDPKVIHAAAKQRADLIVACEKAARIHKVKFDAAGAADMSNDALAAELIGMMMPDFPTEGKSPEYLAGALTMCMRMLHKEEVAEGETMDAPPPPPATDKPAENMGGPMSGPGTVKTDSAKPGKVSGVFKALEASAAPPGARNDASEADRFDTDKARIDMMDRERTRHTKPLGMTKGK